ncbi:MAG: EamA family transporter [Candidatus Aenigmarchaeota archaeon]|nr:EamA family transporter [Candidatus Aenigmarchaeota archaeon]
MLWLILSLSAAFFDAIHALLSKKINKKIDEYVVSWGFRFATLLLTLPFLFFAKIPDIGTPFWTALFISGGLNTITTILYMKALKSSDVSLCFPMTCFTSLFLLITSPIILGEFPNSYGLIGIFLIVFGAYAMNINKYKESFFAPFKALVKEKGPKYMLFVAFLWSITISYDKIGILNSSPVFWVVSIHIFLSITLFPIMLIKSKNIMKQIKPNFSALILIGLASSLLLICQMTGIKLALAVYVTSIRRTSAVISVIFGALLFKEKNIKERLFGAIIMVIGVVVIALT